MARGAVLILLIALSVHVNGQYTSFYDAISKLPNYTILKQLVDAANLTTVLSNGTLPGALLAPDDPAFLATLAAFPGAQALTQNLAAVTLVISYHLISSQSNLSSVTDGTTLPTFLTAFPNATFQAGTLANVTFKQMPQSTYYVGGLSPGGLVSTNQSYTAGAGRLYPLQNGLLIPPSKILTLSRGPVSLTIAELLQNTPGFTNLTSLVLADPTLKAFATNPDNAVTVFAPPDSAFAAFLQSANLTLSSISGTPLAQRIVLNHIVPIRPFASSQLQPPGTPTNSPANNTLPTAYTGDNVTVTSTGRPATSATVLGGGNTSPINITVFNITAGKSVVHVINGLILPNTTSPQASPAPSNLPPGATAPPNLPPGVTAPPPGVATPPPPPKAASMATSSAWLLTTLLGAAMLLGTMQA